MSAEVIVLAVLGVAAIASAAGLVCAIQEYQHRKRIARAWLDAVQERRSSRLDVAEHHISSVMDSVRLEVQL